MRWKPEHDSFAISLFDSCEYEEIAKQLFDNFGAVVTATAVRHRMHRLGLTGAKPSSARRMVQAHQATSSPVGSERTTAGIVWVKVEDKDIKPNGNNGYSTRGNWRKKAYIVWESVHGYIPEGKRIMYLDGDTTNCRIENLYFADLGVQINVAKMGVLSAKNRDLTLAAIKLCELQSSIRKL